MFDIERVAWRVDDGKEDDEKLKPPARFVLVALAWSVSHERVERGYEPEAWPSQTRLKAMTGLSIRTIRRALVELADEGLIEDTGMVKGKGVRVYVVTLDPDLNPGQSDPPSQDQTGQSDRAGGQSDRAGGQSVRQPRSQWPTEPVKESVSKPEVRTRVAPPAATVVSPPIEKKEKQQVQPVDTDDPDSIRGELERLRATRPPGWEKQILHLETELRELASA